MQFLNQALIREHLTMPSAIASIEQLLRTQAQQPDWVKCPDRVVIATQQFEQTSKHRIGSHLTMPALVYDGKHEYAAVKLVTICPDNPTQGLPTTTAVISVSDTATGEVLAVMDGSHITQVRTAALSAIASKYLTADRVRQVAVLGCGGMAYEQLNAILTIRPNIEQVTLWNRTPERTQQFADRFARDYPQWQVTLTPCQDISHATRDADIINLATRAKSGLFEPADIAPNAHINAVGAYLPEMKEVSDAVIAACTHVLVDDRSGSQHEAGDLIQADANPDCSWTWQQLSGDLQDLVTGKIAVDMDNKGLSLFKSVGAASFDAAVAIQVAKLAIEQGWGQQVDGI